MDLFDGPVEQAVGAAEAGSVAWEREVRALMPPDQSLLAWTALDDGSTSDSVTLVTAGDPQAQHRVWVEVVRAGEVPTIEAAVTGAAVVYAIVEGLAASRVSQFRESVLQRAYLGIAHPGSAALDQPQPPPAPAAWPTELPAVQDGSAPPQSGTAAAQTAARLGWRDWLLPTPHDQQWRDALAKFQPTVIVTLEDWSAAAETAPLAGAGLRSLEAFAIPAEDHDRLTMLSPSLPRRNWRRRRVFGERWLAARPRGALGAAVRRYVERMGYPVFGEPYARALRQRGGGEHTIELAPGRYTMNAALRRMALPARIEEGLHWYGAEGLALQVFGGRPVTTRAATLVAALEGALVHTLGLAAET